MTMSNMAIEAGAKNGIFIVDDQTRAYMDAHSDKQYTAYEPDEDAQYAITVQFLDESGGQIYKDTITYTP